MKKTNVIILRNMIIVLTVLFMTIANTYPLFGDVVYEESLVAYWSFDEGSGTTGSDSTGTNDGTFGNNPTWVTGLYGGALSFGGINDYVNCGNDSSLNFGGNAFSVESWIKINDSGLNPILFKGGMQDRDLFFTINSQKLTGGFEQETTGSNITATGATTIATDTWYHVAFTYNGIDEIIVFVNGNSDGNRISSIKPAVNSADLVIGRDAPNGPSYFNGFIDDVAIWNRALDTDEISSIYNVGVQRFEGILEGVTTTFGDLGYTTNQVKQLTDLYASQESGQIGDIDWTYLSENLPGDTDGLIYDIGDTWTYNGKYYIKLGSGLEGAPLGGSGNVPELPAGLIPLLGVILSFGLKRLKYFHK